jgi:pyrroloquinoline quinone biosynthesis protein D
MPNDLDGPTGGVRTNGAVASSSRPTLSTFVRLSFDSARGRHILLGPEAVIVLNETAAAILRLCDGQRTVAEVEAALRDEFDRVADDQTRQFLARLVARRWVRLS